MGVGLSDFSIWGWSGVWEEGLSLVGGSICVRVRRGTGKCFDLVGHIRQVRDTTGRKGVGVSIRGLPFLGLEFMDVV